MTVYIEGIGKITASKDVLNSLALLAGEARDSFENRGLDGLADWADRANNTIYNELDAKGYYNE